MQENKKLTGYDLSRAWFDFCQSGKEDFKINPNHCAFLFFAIEHCNRLGWPESFGLPASLVMECIGIRSYNTYKKTLDDLIEFGFLILVERSRNQWTANRVALSKNDKAIDKATRVPSQNLIKQSESTYQSTSESKNSINKLLNNRTIKLLNKSDKISLTDQFISDLPNSSALQTVAMRIGANKNEMLAFIPEFKKKVNNQYKHFNEFLDHFKNAFLKHKQNKPASVIQLGPKKLGS